MTKQVQASVERAIDLLTSTLPKSDQVGVLARHVAKVSDSLMPEQRQILAAALLSGNPGAETDRQLAQPQSIASQRNAFIENYKIIKLGSSQVSLTLPEGTSRIEFLNEAQAFSIALHALRPDKYTAHQAVWTSRLESWGAEHGFTKATEKELTLRVDGDVRSSVRLSREEQENRGWNDVALQDLAVAHSAFYILSGKSLFKGNFRGQIGRAAGVALSFDRNGLDVDEFYTRHRGYDVSASRYVPATPIGAPQKPIRALAAQV